MLHMCIIIYFLHSTDSLTCGWAPVKPFPLPPTSPCTLELAAINTLLENPHSSYVNHMYAYPIMLNFDSQKIFARARNIACHVEIRDSDSQGATSLNVSYIPSYNYSPSYLHSFILFPVISYPSTLFAELF